MINHSLPDFVQPHDKIVLFDGTCRLCNGWAKFLIRYDKKHRFLLATVQSMEGQKILQALNLSTTDFTTMIVIDQKRVYQQSNAFIQVMAQLPYGWKLATIIWLIPRPARDWLYNRIAFNRYRLFGRNETCLLAQATDYERFLHEKH